MIPFLAVTGVAAVALLLSAGCGVVLIRQRRRLGWLEALVASRLDAQQTEWSGHVERLDRMDRTVTLLEQSAQCTEKAAKGGITRSVRSQAMQLLRTGVTPDTAGEKLGIARNEMRLIAKVFRAISTQN